MITTQIVPAILEYNWLSAEHKIQLIQENLPEVKRVQIDFADGMFVGNQTLSIAEVEKLPDGIEFEAHLMVDNPINLADYIEKGFKTIIIHYESFASEQNLEDALTSIGQLGAQAGLAINPDTPVSALRYFADTVKHFTLLSVQPGFQGAEFVPESFDRMKELRGIAPHAILEVDGSVNLLNAAELKAAGADLLAVGSGLFETKSIAERFAALEEKII